MIGSNSDVCKVGFMNHIYNLIVHKDAVTTVVGWVLVLRMRSKAWCPGTESFHSCAGAYDVINAYHSCAGAYDVINAYSMP